jgi:pimeloyl-ACP methyl ester carboxylesterase
MAMTGAWQAPELEKAYRVITVDHRGHGRSAAPHGSYRPQVLADDAAALLKAVVPGQAAVVFGHSMGTIVASALTIRHPGLTDGLVLVDPVYNAPDDALKPALDAMRGPAPAAAAMFAAAFYTPTLRRISKRGTAAGSSEHRTTWSPDTRSASMKATRE